MNAQALLEENTELYNRLEILESENHVLKSTTSNLETENQTLKTQLEWVKRQLFGKRSEKLMSEEESEQLRLEGFEIKPPQTETKTVKEHTRKKTQGKDAITLPSDLPIEKKVIDLPEKEKVCPQTKKPLEKIGEEITSKLSFKPGQYYIKQIIRPKYATPDGSIKTAPLPESLLDSLPSRRKLTLSHHRAEIC